MSGNELLEVPATALGPIRPLSVRITDGLRAQLEVIAQLNDRSVTEEIRLALEAWVETSKSDPMVLQRAETVRAEIEREAKTKQSAIEAIFRGAPPKGVRAKQASA
ncbi:hypothetical protein [Frigoribacterium sp. 9N]|uniref:hypothetical protein n=1 Tax=Frigoribacterium sp. 9N TaxID=2653144 RepID=UPI0012F1B61D|nr:hypothetical protein [Frigoribacterium sp. 9N]VXB67037.1 conserved hypothetical protein [Frigoribacterium sp. 9N]